MGGSSQLDIDRAALDFSFLISTVLLVLAEERTGGRATTSSAVHVHVRSLCRICAYGGSLGIHAAVRRR